MAKAWRRSARVVPVAPVPDPPVLVAIGGDLVEVTGLTIPSDFPYIWSYYGPTAAGPWTLLGTDPVNGDPTTVDYTGHTGEWAMARIGTGGEPLSLESNAVEVT